MRSPYLMMSSQPIKLMTRKFLQGKWDHTTSSSTSKKKIYGTLETMLLFSPNVKVLVGRMRSKIKIVLCVIRVRTLFCFSIEMIQMKTLLSQITKRLRRCCISTMTSLNTAKVTTLHLLFWDLLQIGSLSKCVMPLFSQSSGFLSNSKNRPHNNLHRVCIKSKNCCCLI